MEYPTFESRFMMQSLFFTSYLGSISLFIYLFISINYKKFKCSLKNLVQHVTVNHCVEARQNRITHSLQRLCCDLQNAEHSFLSLPFPLSPKTTSQTLCLCFHFQTQRHSHSLFIPMSTMFSCLFSIFQTRSLTLSPLPCQSNLRAGEQRRQHSAQYSGTWSPVWALDPLQHLLQHLQQTGLKGLPFPFNRKHPSVRCGVSLRSIHVEFQSL